MPGCNHREVHEAVGCFQRGVIIRSGINKCSPNARPGTLKPINNLHGIERYFHRRPASIMVNLHTLDVNCWIRME